MTDHIIRKQITLDKCRIIIYRDYGARLSGRQKKKKTKTPLFQIVLFLPKNSQLYAPSLRTADEIFAFLLLSASICRMQANKLKYSICHNSEYNSLAKPSFLTNACDAQRSTIQRKTMGRGGEGTTMHLASNA